MWQKRYLTHDFFRAWSQCARGVEIAPHKIKFKRYVTDGVITPNSIEIMEKSNLEIKRQHAHKGSISPELMAACQFHIVKIDETGITIRGHGLPGNKARMRF